MNLTKYLLAALMWSLTFSCQSSSKDQTPPPIKKFRIEKPKETPLNIPYRSLDISKVITTFAFGSCNDQNQPQPLWKTIKSHNPQLFLMMGDNVYASTAENKPIINQYIKLNSNKDYLELRESTPFLATWDDHDYGQQDGGGDNPEKAEAKKAFLNYWTYLKTIIPKDHNGIYHSRILGEKKQRVQFIMLDTRIARSPLTKNTEILPEGSVPRPYKQSDDIKAQILSEAQWAWLENELKKPAELRILISSIQFAAEDHGFEKWSNFPFEKRKMVNLLEKLKIKNLVVLSGDRHLSAIAKMPLKKFDLYDITSSGLNKPSPAKEPETDQLYTAPSFLKINFGLATIDWSKKQVEFQIIDENDKSQLSQIIHF